MGGSFIRTIKPFKSVAPKLDGVENQLQSNRKFTRFVLFFLNPLPVGSIATSIEKYFWVVGSNLLL